MIFLLLHFEIIFYCRCTIASSESVVREEGRDALLVALQVSGAERAAFVFVFVADIRVSVFFRE